MRIVPRTQTWKQKDNIVLDDVQLRNKLIFDIRNILRTLLMWLSYNAMKFPRRRTWIFAAVTKETSNDKIRKYTVRDVAFKILFRWQFTIVQVGIITAENTTKLGKRLQWKCKDK